MPIWHLKAEVMQPAEHITNCDIFFCHAVAFCDRIPDLKLKSDATFGNRTTPDFGENGPAALRANKFVNNAVFVVTVMRSSRDALLHDDSSTISKCVRNLNSKAQITARA